MGEDVVLCQRRGPVAVPTMNRPEYRSAQNSAMTCALDAAFTRAGPVVRLGISGVGYFAHPRGGRTAKTMADSARKDA